MYFFVVNNFLITGVRQYTDVETYMTSVERITEFGKLDREELEGDLEDPDENWPPKGDIKYQNVSLIYPNASLEEPSKAVLSKLNFKIKGGEKIGIVGRTGAGKSSLITTLFRLTPPDGSIIIDGINTGSIR